MRMTELSIGTNGPGLYEFTKELRTLATGAGLMSLFVRHTSCSLLIQENADPEVKTDLNNFFTRLVPDANDPSMSYLTHRYEGPDDMPAHIKASLLPVNLQIPIIDGVLGLGTWQGVYLFEHRLQPHDRKVVVHVS